MHLTGLDLVFWAAGFWAHLILLCVLLIRHRAQVFPFFTVLITANVLRTLVLFAVSTYDGKAAYFYTFWILGILDTVLQLMVVYEVCSLTFRPLGVWARDVRASSGSVFFISILLAIGLTWLDVPHTRLWMQAVIIRGDLFSSLYMSEFFVGMLALSVTAGLPWKTHVARISQGLGVYSILDVLIEAAHSYFGVTRNTETYTTLSHFRMAVYFCCVIYWIVTLWRDGQEPRTMPPGLREQLIQLQRIADLDLTRIRARRQS